MAQNHVAYPNLRAEMARLNILISDIAATIHTTRDTAGAKLSRKRPIYLDEAFQIADKYFPEQDIRFLFAYDRN